MGDHFGAMTLPATAGQLDPALGTLLSFARAVLLASVQPGWGDLDPRQIVHTTGAYDPRRGAIVDDKLPGLFAFRSRGDFTDLAQGLVEHEGAITIAWIFPPGRVERRELQDAVVVALAKALAVALSDGRHPAWTHPDDEADPDAIRLPAAAPTVDTTYSGAALDGAVGAGPFAEPRRLRLTTTLGNWDTTKPIVVTAPLPDGTEWTEEILLTSPTGPEEIDTTWTYAGATEFFVPEQPSSAGTLAVGLATANGSEWGSLIKDKLGATFLQCDGWRREPIELRSANGTAQRYEAVTVAVQVQERRERTADAFDYPLLDDCPDGIGMIAEVRRTDTVSLVYGD